MFMVFIVLWQTWLAHARFDLERVTDPDVITRMHGDVIWIARAPRELAAEYARRVENVGERWPAGYLLELRTLDLIAYLFAVEQAQYYASAGHWEAPPHRHRTEHLAFYHRHLDRRGSPEPIGSAHDTTYPFAEEFLRRLIIQPGARARAVLNALASSGREFWRHHLLKQFSRAPHFPVELAHEVIAHFEIAPTWPGNINYTDVAEAIFKRGRGDEVTLLHALYDRILLRGEFDVARIHADHAPALRPDHCQAKLAEVDTFYVENFKIGPILER